MCLSAAVGKLPFLREIWQQATRHIVWHADFIFLVTDLDLTICRVKASPVGIVWTNRMLMNCGAA